MTPVVTICIPTYRRLEFLKEAVRAAQRQTLREIEILISDDGTSSELRDWSEGCVKSDPRVRYRRNERNLGLGGNWNACVAEARGDWLVIQGDDDRLLPNFCDKLLALAASDSSVLFANHYVIDAHGRRLLRESDEWTTRYGRHLLARGQVPEVARCVWRNSVPMTSALVRAGAIKRLGIKPDLNTPEIELFARLAAERARFDFEPDYLAEFRSHAGSSTASGLFAERLVRYLEPIPVPPDAEAIKRAFMEPAVRSAVDRLLRAGQQALASELIRSQYYPRNLRDPTLLAQRLATSVPLGLGARAYLFARRLHEARGNMLSRHQS